MGSRLQDEKKSIVFLNNQYRTAVIVVLMNFEFSITEFFAEMNYIIYGRYVNRKVRGKERIFEDGVLIYYGRNQIAGDSADVLR